MDLFKKIRDYVMSWLRPSIYVSGLGEIARLWREASAKDRGILLLVFAPTFMCVGGFLFSLVYFVLFVLPLFLIRLLGWMVLTAIFAFGGRFCYRYFTGHDVDLTNEGSEEGRNNSPHYSETIIDVQYDEAGGNSDSEANGDSNGRARTSRRRKQ